MGILFKAGLVILLTLWKACISFYLDSFLSRSSNDGIWGKLVCFYVLNLDLLLTDIVPASLVGVSFGPVGAKLLHIMQWGGNEDDKRSEIAFVRPASR